MVTATGGWVEEGNRRYLIRAVGELTDIDEIRDVVVGYRNTVPIYLGDLGDISWDIQEPENTVRYKGQPAVGLSLYKESGSNTVEVVKTVRKFLEESKRSLPKKAKLEVAYDQSIFITRSIDEVKSSALQGAGLAIIILLIFLRSIRSTFVVGISIPVSIIATFNLMYFMDLSLNVMTLGGLALGAGMLVDNAIVCTRKYFSASAGGGGRQQTQPYSARREVSSAIIASTLTTVVVFLPIAWIGGLTAQLFKEQALTVVFSLLTSLVVALLMIPALAARMLKNRRYSKKERRYRLYSAFLSGSLRFAVGGFSAYGFDCCGEFQTGHVDQTGIHTPSRRETIQRRDAFADGNGNWT